MRTDHVRLGLAVLALALVANPSAAEEAEGDRRLEEVERRLEELEDAVVGDDSGKSSRATDWARYVRVGGSANAAFFAGEENSGFDPASFQIWDARFFIDANLGDAVTVFDETIFRNIGLSFEWNLVRLGDLDNNVGELYLDFQEVLGQEAINFQVGRFQLPVGESYLRYSRGYAKKPFISNTVGGPWWWDEGIRLYGSFADGKLGYVAAVSDGDTAFNTDVTGDKLTSLKLYWHATPWLYFSVSGLRTGKLGSSDSPASGALWLGEFWARSIGSRTNVDTYQDGVVVSDAPNRIDDSWFVGADIVVEEADKLRIWLAGGRYAIGSPASGYDRAVYYWIAEVVLRGAWATPQLSPFYLGLRANAIGTYDDDKGHLLDAQRSGTLGYNMTSLTDYSAVVGWDLNDYVTFRAEYTRSDIDIVDGASRAIRSDAEGTDYFGIEIGGSF